jgi:hypothetical protein
MNMDFWRPLKESKPDPPTNRQWLESLSNKQLAEFLTCGLYVHTLYEIQDNLPEGVYLRDSVMNINFNVIKMRYTQSHTGVEHWLNSSQEFEVIREGTSELD